MTVPESHEDQINNLNKITVLEDDKVNVKKLQDDDLINDDYFRNLNVTKKDYERMIELAVEAYVNTDGKLSKEDEEKYVQQY
jgi:hypothetical protein